MAVKCVHALMCACPQVAPSSLVLPPRGSQVVALRGPSPDACLSSATPASSSTALAARDTLLRVFSQHLACGGTGALPALTQGVAPALLRVRHEPF